MKRRLPIENQIQCSIHTNLNPFCAISIETTGPSVDDHCITRICMIPLNNMYEPAKGVMPFMTSFKPDHDKAESDWVRGDAWNQLLLKGHNPAYAAQMMELWFQKLPMQKDKKLCPIVYDWGFMTPFLNKLMGQQLFSEMFYPDTVRDISGTAAYVNDVCDLTAEQVPFPRYQFQPICNKLGITVDEPKGDILNMCKATAVAYKALLRRTYRGITL